MRHGKRKSGEARELVFRDVQVGAGPGFGPGQGSGPDFGISFFISFHFLFLFFYFYFNFNFNFLLFFSLLPPRTYIHRTNNLDRDHSMKNRPGLS